MGAVAGQEYSVIDYGADPSGKRDSTYAFQAALNALVDDGGGVLDIPKGTYICNDPVAPGLYSGTGIVRGAGRDTTTLNATAANTNAVLGLQGNWIVSDLTVDGGGQAVTGLSIATPNGQDSRIAGLYRVRCRNVSTTSGPGWVFVIWGQASNNTYNIARAWIEDVEAEGPTNPNYDALSVSGVDTCFVRGLVIDGVNRTPNLYAIRRLIIDGLTCINSVNAGLVIDADVLHTQAANIFCDASSPAALNMSGEFANCRFDAQVQLNQWKQYPHYRFVNCQAPNSLAVENPVGSLTIEGGAYGGAGGNSSVTDVGPPANTQGPWSISGAQLANNIVRSYNGCTIPLRVDNCRGFVPGRTIIDGHTTTGSAVITSATAEFTSGDVGRTIEDSSNGANLIPAGATIASVQSATQATMNANATGTGAADVMVLGSLTPALGLYGVTLAAGSRIAGTTGYNPVGHGVPQPAVPAANTNVTNTTGVDCTVAVTGGAGVTVAIGGTSTGLSSGNFRVPAGQTISLGGYTAAPTWAWFGD